MITAQAAMTNGDGSEGEAKSSQNHMLESGQFRWSKQQGLPTQLALERHFTAEGRYVDLHS